MLYFPVDMMEEALCARVEGQINNAFSQHNQKLISDYFEMLKGKDALLFYELNARGGAITYPIPYSEYLCKLYVIEYFEGEGIASKTVDLIVEKYQSVSLRTDIGKSRNREYFHKLMNRHNGQSIEQEKYEVYLIGVDDHLTKHVVDEVISIPETLQPL